MSTATRISDYDKLLERCRDKYGDIRELSGCFVIPNDKGSVIVYKLGHGKNKYVICSGDKREEISTHMIDHQISKYFK